MSLTHEVAVSVINLEPREEGVFLDVRVVIKSYRKERHLLFWSSTELAKEESKFLTFVYRPGKGWHQIIKGKEVKCRCYIYTHPGRFHLSYLTTLWINAERGL